MTREVIIKSLEDGITSWGMYNVNWDAMDAIEADDNPFSFVQPILDIIGSNPDIDFGTPGQLVYFVEKFSSKGYEELLIESVKKSPTPHNIWMLHRCYNDPHDSRKNDYKILVEKILQDDTTPDYAKRAINDFDWD